MAAVCVNMLDAPLCVFLTKKIHVIFFFIYLQQTIDVCFWIRKLSNIFYYIYIFYTCYFDNYECADSVILIRTN